MIAGLNLPILMEASVLRVILSVYTNLIASGTMNALLRKEMKTQWLCGIGRDKTSNFN